MYKCKYCNEEFDNKYKLTGHAVHCKLNPDKTKLFICEFCSCEVIGKHSYTQHKNHCELNPDKKEYKYTVHIQNNNPSNCKYCGKECKNHNSLINHERMCKLNPESSFREKFTYKNHISWNKGLTKETDSRVKQQSESQLEYYKTHEGTMMGKHHSPEVLAKFNRYHSSKRGIYQDILFMSTWELAYYLYMKDQGHNIIRCEDWYEYEIEGIVHRYNPDFIVDGTQIIEIKGYKTDIDDIKWKCIPNLIIINKNKIKPYVKYVKDKYQVEKLEDLYDRRIN